jgi:hypothetical protein
LHDVLVLPEHESDTFLQKFAATERVVLGGVMFIVDPGFTDSNAADSDEFLRTIKVRSTSSFGEVVKPSAPCRKMLRHVKDPFGI